MTEPSLPKNLSSHLLQPLIHLLVSLCSIYQWGATHSSLDFSRCPSWICPSGQAPTTARREPWGPSGLVMSASSSVPAQDLKISENPQLDGCKLPSVWDGLGMFSHPTGFGFYCCTLAISRWYTVADMPCNLTEHLQDYAGKVGWQLQCIESMMCFGFHCSKKPIAGSVGHPPILFFDM